MVGVNQYPIFYFFKFVWGFKISLSQAVSENFVSTEVVFKGLVIQEISNPDIYVLIEKLGF